MVLTKEEIWERLRTDSVWVTQVRTQLTPLPAPNVVAARQMRMIPMIFIPGNSSMNTAVQFEKLEIDGITFTMKFCPVPVATLGLVAIPPWAYRLEEPVLTLEGGTRLFATCTQGTSVNVTIEYWDLDI